MDMIKKKFDNYVERMFDGRANISDKQYSDIKAAYYTGFAACFDFFKNDLRENDGVFELYMIEKELQQYLNDLAGQVLEKMKIYERIQKNE